MIDISPEGIAAARAELGIPDDHIPRSVAIIMDGNGRWARHRGLPRVAGHAQGALVVRDIVKEARRLGLDALTLYGFSVQNWNRPADEIDALMDLYAKYLDSERQMVISHNICMRHIGRRDGLPGRVLEEIDRTVDVSRQNTGMYLCLALNYGSRAEITDMIRKLAARVRDGEIDPDQIDGEMISDSLDTAGVPDPDLVIRTSGELRVSNFLLWQISYAELYVTQTHWPDFDQAEFRKALKAYASRHRRFGRVDNSNQ